MTTLRSYPVASKTSDVGFRIRQLECMRAFQSGLSWYDAYCRGDERHPLGVLPRG
jgi:hypothetical protein